MTRPRCWFLAIAILLAMLTTGWAEDEEYSLTCDPSYPTVCIPLYPPDLDCNEIPYRDFDVSDPDPHGFDADYDGVGCEFWPPRDLKAVPPQ